MTDTIRFNFTEHRWPARPGCGEWGCWPFTVNVVISGDRVKWTNPRHGHRDWDYSAIGQWEFDRTHYERALEALPTA